MDVSNYNKKVEFPSGEVLTLYHGTSEQYLKSILKNGLLPRKKKKGNWDGRGASNPDLVYLTNCYAPYYASCTKGKGRGVVVKFEVDIRKVQLWADEEFIYHYLKQEHKDKFDEENTKLSDIEARDYGEEAWKDSLNYLGTVSAEFIPPECAVAYSVEPSKLYYALNQDPSLSPIHYKILGYEYKRFLEGLEWKDIKK